MLTTSERNYLLNSMQELLVEYDYEYSTSALEDIIDEWARQKEGLIEAFKTHPNYLEGKFMIAFDADYERKIEYGPSYDFKNWVLGTALPELDGKFPAEVQEKVLAANYLPQHMWDFFYYIANYAERCISESTASYINNTFPTVHAHVGQKTSRVVNKICTYLGINKVDGYNREFAKYADSLSPMVIKRHTILSLNPLDYLTMSFGNSWASCHTIDKANKRGMPNDYSGCYSSGTVSYMLDPSSMVLYTVDASYDGNEYWTQPKINRQMFHYGEEKLVQARLYPQDNDGCADIYAPYRNIVQQIISEIFNIPNLWTLSKGTDAASRFINSYGTHYRDYHFYNNCTLSRVKGSENNNSFDVGARPICIECGHRHGKADIINCCHGQYICCDCGARVDEDDVVWINGDPYCRDCCYWCDRCEEWHRVESTWIPSEDRYVCEDCLRCWYVQCARCGEYEYQDDVYYIDCEERYVCSSCCSDHYSYCDDCGEYFPSEDTNYYEHLTLCDNCYNERTRANEDEYEDEEV